MTPDDNIRFASTTQRWKYVKIACPPEATQTARRRRTFKALSRWNPRTPLPAKVTYRGGAECWYEVHARGAVIRVPGYTTIHDLMQAMYGGQAKPVDHD